MPARRFNKNTTIMECPLAVERHKDDLKDDLKHVCYSVSKRLPDATVFEAMFLILWSSKSHYKCYSLPKLPCRCCGELLKSMWVLLMQHASR
jgi:hypothetical protein